MGASFRVAVTSRDGVSVNERFHRAADWFVFEVEGERVRFVERRARPPTAARVFRDFAVLAALLRDCRWIVSLGFNVEAKRELGARGFLLRETRGPIEPVIGSLASDTVIAP